MQGTRRRISLQSGEFAPFSAFSGEEETHPVIYTDSAALKEWETLPLKGKIRSEKGFLKIVLFTS